MARAVEWARSNDVVQRVQFDVYARNEAALGLYRKFGFEIEGRHKRAYFKGGEYIDSLSMALLL
jgi:putative acetyltransferase